MVISILANEHAGDSEPSSARQPTRKALLLDLPQPRDVESEVESGKVGIS